MLVEMSITVYAVAVLILLLLLPSWYKGSRLYAKRDRFRCTLCGNCCRFRITPITEEDVKLLEKAGYKGFWERKGELKMRRDNGRCVFLKDDRCAVHEHRPQVCREFPFFKECGIGYVRKASFCPALEELENG
jgi:Fe-S-cluster containining protein